MSLLSFLAFAVATLPAQAAPEYVIYRPNQPSTNLPIVAKPEETKMVEAGEAKELERFGIFPVRSYPHVIRFTATWHLGERPPTRPAGVRKYIIQVALAGDEGRAQVLLLQEELAANSDVWTIQRYVGSMDPTAFRSLRDEVLRVGASLSGRETGLERGVMSCSHATTARVEMHSGGPAQLDLRRDGECNNPKTTFAAGNLIRKAAEQALRRSIRQP